LIDARSDLIGSIIIAADGALEKSLSLCLRLLTVEITTWNPG
jgi:hypothetical protein